MTELFDVIVIGAGINGCGIARCAARRGLRVLLVDRGDIANGTTSASTRLIHGGLRYLENLDVRLVRESLRERNMLLQTAPHLVQPIPFVLPIFANSRRGVKKISTGLRIYRALDTRSPLPAHRILNSRQLHALEPGLRESDLVGGAMYWDAQVSYPERLALENAIDAHRHGATIVTYAQDVALIHNSGRVGGISFEHSNTSREALAPVVVNATGPWVDALVDAGSPPVIGATRGTHITVERWAHCPSHAIYSEATDGRPMFIIPWNDLMLIGTTDVPSNTEAMSVDPEPWEIDYLVASANNLLRDHTVDRMDVKYAYAGLRPLPRRSATTPGKVSRRHALIEHDGQYSGLLSVVGGKITTYRGLADEVVGFAARSMSQRLIRSDTGHVPLPGAGDSSACNNPDVDATSLDRIRSIYGVRSIMIANLAKKQPELAHRLSPSSNAIGAEVVFTVREEFATTVEDILLRRTMLGLGGDLGVAALPAVAAIAGNELGWDASRRHKEQEAYLAEVRRRQVATDQQVESKP